MFLTPSDFVDKYALSTGMYDTAKLTSYILKYEERYLVHLLGAKMYNSFISDLATNVPRSPNFKKIFNPFIEDLSTGPFIYSDTFGGLVNGSILESEGMLEMLKGFIYFEYAKDLMNQMTPYGNVKQRAENSVVVDSPHSMMYSRYNEAIKTYRAIQSYIYLNQSLPIGQAIDVSIETAGATYVDGIYDLTGGTGTGAKATVTTTAGAVTGVIVSTDGDGYVIGDVLTINGGDGLATISLTYVGVGSFQDFNGVYKSTAYWI